MPGSLTTHVLDTTHGLPAANMIIQLWSLEIAGEGRTLLKTVRTTADGRTDQPLLVDDEMQIGIYELLFVVGPYFATQTITTTMPPFLDSVPVRFGISDADAHYHVPLLVSPWAYSTYRGN